MALPYQLCEIEREREVSAVRRRGGRVGKEGKGIRERSVEHLVRAPFSPSSWQNLFFHAVRIPGGTPSSPPSGRLQVNFSKYVNWFRDGHGDICVWWVLSYSRVL